MSSDEADSADQELLERVEREAHESLYSLRCGQLADRQAALQAEINHAQRSGDLTRINELTVQKFELAKQERALAQLAGNGAKGGR